MQCINPISIKRPNGWGSADRIAVPCGTCEPCLHNKRAAWVFRINQELKSSKTSVFVTFTYEKAPNIPKRKEIQDLVKRIRINLNRGFVFESRKYAKYDTSIKYFASSEFGELFGRVHFHAIFFNLPPDPFPILQKSWNKGFVTVGDVIPQRVAYVTGYILDKEDDEERKKVIFSLKSNGLGKNYLSKQNVEFHKKNQAFFSYMEGGIPISLPRYYREKIFNGFQKIDNRLKAIKQNDEKENQLVKDHLLINQSYYEVKGEQIKQHLERLIKRRLQTKKAKRFNYEQVISKRKNSEDQKE